MQDFTYAIRTIEPAFRQLRDMDPFRLDQYPSPVPTGLGACTAKPLAGTEANGSSQLASGVYGRYVGRLAEF